MYNKTLMGFGPIFYSFDKEVSKYLDVHFIVFSISLFEVSCHFLCGYNVAKSKLNGLKYLILSKNLLQTFYLLFIHYFETNNSCDLAKKQ